MRTILTTLILVASFAQAETNLINNGKSVVCYADDNQSWSINASRTKMKYTVEGESLGSSKIYETEVDGKTAVIYRSKVGTMTLMSDRSLFEFDGEDYTFEINCK